jgi:hypothetical protein|tara:strand:- start:77 stop:619 length:543 start_codon:yes stop_codon:yes gene_type:complete
MSCTNVNAKKKEYVYCVTDPRTDLKFCYSQLRHGPKQQFVVTTPPMICPFGINNQNNNFKMCLQFTNYKSDNVMNSFYEFIQTCEYKQMELLGLDESSSDLFISQIKHDAKGRYDPNLEVKIPFSYNRFNCDIYSDSYDGVGIMNISKFCKLQCDIYLDKIWKYNDNYISKWKVKMIHLL